MICCCRDIAGAKLGRFAVMLFKSKVDCLGLLPVRLAIVDMFVAASIPGSLPGTKSPSIDETLIVELILPGFFTLRRPSPMLL